jgi:hypothetical protein
MATFIMGESLEIVTYREDLLPKVLQRLIDILLIRNIINPFGSTHNAS